ncbi:MAG: addiction module protein [Candidatus Hydrogenedens sp.]|nr:addiction module protein [Candidatus Hydrogenedentota bacterium]NLF56343.1 addiction module protein [Candidatus Hydrogenedens sp.]
MSLAQVEKEALKLTVEERALLAERLLDSLDANGGEYDEEAWLNEAERRHSAYKAGHIPSKEMAAAMQCARQALQ